MRSSRRLFVGGDDVVPKEVVTKGTEQGVIEFPLLLILLSVR